MTARQRAATIDADKALETLGSGGRTGPLGDFIGTDIAAMRNDTLPLGDTYAETEDDKLTALVSQVTGSDQGEGFVSIWKRDPEKREMGYVGKANASIMLADGPHDFLVRNFGSGDYELKIYDSNKKLFKRPTTTVPKIAEEYIKKQAQKSSSVENEIAPLLRVMSEGFQQLGQLIVQSRPQQESRAQMLDEMIKMKQLFAGNESRGNSGDPVDMFSKMVVLFKQLQPRPASEENLLVDLADRFLPMITQAMQKPEQGASPVMLPGAAPAPVAPNPAAPAHQLSPEQIGASKMNLHLKMQLLYLCTQAARDSDPAPYAAIICDQVPKETLYALINDGNWLDALARIHPGVKQHAEWFNELYDAVVEELASMETEAAENSDNLQENGIDAINPRNLPGDSESDVS